MSRTIRAFAPASVSNIACGFDVMGFAIEGPGDEVVAERRDEPGIVVAEIIGDDGRLPLEPDRNTASVAVRELLGLYGIQEGVTLRIHKKMPLSSGLGSSAASAVAAAKATSELLGLNAEKDALLRCAIEGERTACGSAHPDNATPCVYGGLVLIRPGFPMDVIELPVPDGLTCALVRPHVEVETRAAREALGDTVPLAAAVQQWGNLGALVAGLFKGDLDLISRSLTDSIAEPQRAHLVPGFPEAQAAALNAGALGCSLSGSGPSIFALCDGRSRAEAVADAMAAAVGVLGLGVDRFVSPVGAEGARIVPE